MNPKIKKTRDELERTKAKIIELQALVPQLERSIIDMENTDIIKAVRSADIAPADLPAFIASLKNAGAGASERAVTPTPAQESSRLQDEPTADDAEDFYINTINDEEENANA
jgi:hypothetical protein